MNSKFQIDNSVNIKLDEWKVRWATIFSVKFSKVREGHITVSYDVMLNNGMKLYDIPEDRIEELSHDLDTTEIQ